MLYVMRRKSDGMFYRNPSSRYQYGRHDWWTAKLSEVIPWRQKGAAKTCMAVDGLFTGANPSGYYQSQARRKEIFDAQYEVLEVELKLVSSVG